MKLYRKSGVLICESNYIVAIAGYLSAGKQGLQNAKAAAFFPIVFIRSKKHASPLFLNHERIHFRQQIESLFIGVFLLTLVERLYFLFFTDLSLEDRYLATAIEQEAYRNQHNSDYLQERNIFSIFRYIFDKRKLTFIPDSEPTVTIGKKMNFK